MVMTRGRGFRLVTARLMQAPIHLYRGTLKPLIGVQCRHLPTCSEYALEAIEKNGGWRGFWLILSRLLRCNPLGTHGYDPAPDLSACSHPLRPWRYGRWGGQHLRDRPEAGPD